MYSVFLKTDVHPFPLEELARFRTEALGGIAYDNIQHLRLWFGRMAEGLDRYAATALVEILENNGYSAGVKEDAAIRRFDNDRNVSRADLSGERLLIETDVSGSREEIDWGDVALVALGRVPDPRLKMSAVRERAFGSRRRTINKPVSMDTITVKAQIIEERGALLQLFLRSPRPVVAIRPTSFFYDYLGDRRRTSAAENFALLIDDLQQFATGAYWPIRTREYIDGGVEAAGDFQNVAEFSRYHQWLYEGFVDP